MKFCSGVHLLFKRMHFYKVKAVLGVYSTKLGIWDLVKFCVMQNYFLLVCEIRTNLKLELQNVQCSEDELQMSY